VDHAESIRTGGQTGQQFGDAASRHLELMIISEESVRTREPLERSGQRAMRTGVTVHARQCRTPPVDAVFGQVADIQLLPRGASHDHHVIITQLSSHCLDQVSAEGRRDRGDRQPATRQPGD
jgi:hypothetical protein